MEERLTNKDKKGFISIKLDKPVTLPEIRSYAEDLAFNRLFDYEDTNLSPVEIETLKAALELSCTKEKGCPPDSEKICTTKCAHINANCCWSDYYIKQAETNKLKEER